MQQNNRIEIPRVDALKRSLIDDCVDRLREGATVVVDTQRLQHLVADEFNRRMQADGLTVWPSAEVFTFSAWLSRLWQDYANQSEQTVSVLLSGEQSRQIWERVISENVRSQYSEGYEYLLWHITATANQVKNAYGQICSYGIDPDAYTDHISIDVAHFRDWLQAYRHTLVKHSAIDHECLADHVGNAVENLFGTERPSIVFAGIDTWTPQLERLIESLERVDCAVEILEANTVPFDRLPQRFEFDTTDEEINACARWARVSVEANPEVHRIGIVVPNLREIGPGLSRALSDYLNPDALMEDRQTNKLSFHITLSGSLNEVPIVVDAMNLLELIRPTVSIEVMTSIVMSDRIKGWDQESAGRAKLANEIYGVGGDRLSLDDLIYLEKKIAAKKNDLCPELIKVLHKAKQTRSEQPERADYASWGRYFMGWMEIFQSKKKGDRQFGVDEWQAYRSWVAIVQSLAELGFVETECTVETALAKLVRSVREANVQPRAVRTPVQVGEYLSMAGQTFTHLWMLGMNEKALPGSPRPTPFIPISVQKNCRIASSSAEELNKQVQRRFERIVSSAQHVVQSYARTDKGEHFQRSHLLRLPGKLSLEASEELASCRDYLSLLAMEYRNSETFNDWRAPAVQLKGGVTSGGTSLLKDQSNCPFRAFAVHRLHLKQGPSLDVGVTRLARGLLMHAIAESLYKTYPSPEQFKALSESGDLSNIVRECVESEVETFNSARVRPFSREIAEVEVSILLKLAEALVNFDLQRFAKGQKPLDLHIGQLSNANYELWAAEHWTEIELSGMTLTLKIDRIDDCNGKLILIDYKTGACSLSDSGGKKPYTYRPKDPQLAIYAVAMDQQEHKVRDVAYYQLKNGELSTHTWFEYSQGRAKATPIDELLNSNSDTSWLAVLNQIAGGYIDGDAVADPLNSYDTCRYCHVKPVCRIKCKADI